MSAVLTSVPHDELWWAFKRLLPTYNLVIYKQIETYNMQIDMFKPSFKFTAIIPYDCKDPITYFKDHYPEFFI